jgi:thiamine biosynthesis lipoprotein
MPEEAHPLRLARFAMGTRFEAVLFGADEVEMRSAGEEALDEIDALNDRLDLFRKDSFLSFLNAMAYSKPVRMDAELFELLALCQKVTQDSDGAFDITVGSLMTCWGFHQGSPGTPVKAELEQTIESVGFELLDLDHDNLSVRFLRPGMRLDFGAVAKGFALDRAGEILKDRGIQSALLHGGTSSILALGAPPGAQAWRVGVRDPRKKDALLRVGELVDCAFSVSAPHGRAFEQDGKTMGHVMDPVTGAPADSATLVAAICPSAALADAWATALLVAGPERFGALVQKVGWMTALLLRMDGLGSGIEIQGPCKERFKQPGTSTDVLEIEDDNE